MTVKKSLLDSMGSGAWPFLVGGVPCRVDSDNERDFPILNSCCLSKIIDFKTSLTKKVTYIIIINKFIICNFL